MRCHYQGCALVRGFVFLSICLCTMGNRLVFMPMKSFTHFQSFHPPTSLPFFPSPLSIRWSHFFSLSPSLVLASSFFLCHCFIPPSLCPHSILFFKNLYPSLPVLTSCAPLLSSSLSVNTVIAWGALHCITDLSPLVLFMALSPFKFNQASMEPPEPFQFTTWMPQDGKSYANIKV